MYNNKRGIGVEINMLINYLNGLILSVIVIFIPFFITMFFWLFKIKLNKNKMVYLYAFTTGLLLILSCFGFMKESYLNLEEYFHNKENYISTIIIISVMSSGIILGLLFGIVTKLIFLFKSKKQCKSHKNNIHGDCAFDDDQIIKNNNKFVGIFLIVFHKCIDGLSLGFLQYESAGELMQLNNLGIIAGFIVHIIPMTIVMYYFMLDQNKYKKPFITLIKASSTNLVIIPFIFLGILISINIQNIYWLMPFLLCVSGGSLLFTSIMELAPEFLHKHHLCTKEWFFVILWLSIGIVFSIALTLVHKHDTSSMHNYKNIM